MSGFTSKILGLLLFVLNIYNVDPVVTSDSIILTCPYSVNNYVWKRYTQNEWSAPLINDGKYGNVDTKQLTIMNVDAVDNGQYSCTVNSNQEVIFLHLIVMPLIIKVLNQTYFIAVGGNVTLGCFVTGYPIASDIWWTDSEGTRLNGTRYSIGNHSAPSLTIKNVIQPDSGQYTCLATNTGGTNNQSTQLEIGYGPYAEVAQRNYVLKRGENVTIKCNVTNADAVHWYKNGSVLSEGIKYNFSAFQDKDLVIYDVDTADRGGYKCIVTNTFGEYTDDTFLQVVHTVISTLSYERTANESVTLKCLIYDASDVKWWHNEKYIPAVSGRYSGGNITVPSLTVYKLTRDDAGIYQCVSFLGSVSSVSSGIELNIRDKPLVKSLEENIQAIIGGDAIIQCSYDSYPESTGVSWRKDGNILNVNDDAKYNGSTMITPSLTIYNIMNTDSGIYVCYVENSLGMSSGRYVKLTVKEPFEPYSNVGNVAGGISGGAVAVVIVVVALRIYAKRKWSKSRQNDDYEARDNAKVEVHLYDETQRPYCTNTNSPVYVNTYNELTSNMDSMDTTLTMYDTRDFMQILQDKSSLSKLIRKEYEVLNSSSILRAASDYEIVDVKAAGETIPEVHTHKALIKKYDDGTGYIITTVPEQSHIDHFWTMITNYHVGYIVLLLQEVEKISEFFPNTIEPINTNTFKVEICSFDKIQNNIFVFVLAISNKENNTVVTVKLYKIKGWKVREIHPSIDTVCKLLEVISSKEHGMVALMGSKNIGFPVCGDLGACHEVLHAINNEKDFSILQIAVGLKHIRPDLFQTCEEYTICYKVIDHFLQNEHIYAVIDQ